MTDGTLLSPWLVLPFLGLLMIVISIHIDVTNRATQPSSRKRIRVANGWVMLISVPLVAAGASLLNPDSQPYAFVLVWTAAVGLLLISLGLAALDVANTFRLAIRRHRTMKKELHKILEEAVQQSKAGQGHKSGSLPSSDDYASA